MLGDPGLDLVVRLFRFSRPRPLAEFERDAHDGRGAHRQPRRLCGPCDPQDNGWGAGYNGEYNVVSAFGFEVVATFLFRVCILGVTHPFAPTGFAGLAIGLTLAAIHLVGINITGTSVNPARSIGPALIGAATKPQAVTQLWLFIIAPLIGAGAAGFLFREGALLTPPSSSTSR